MIIAVDSCGHSDPPPIMTSTLKARIQGLLINCPAGAGVTVAGDSLSSPFTATGSPYSTGNNLGAGIPYTVRLTGVSGFNTEVSALYNKTDHTKPAAAFIPAGSSTVTPLSVPAGASDSSYVDLWWRCSRPPVGATETPTETPPGGATATPTPITPPPAPGLDLQLDIVDPVVKTTKRQK